MRISESLAKMSLSPFATEQHVDEAIRLFKVSTLDAAMSQAGSGDSDLVMPVEEILKIEKQLYRRFFVGAQVSEKRILEDFSKQGFSEAGVRKVLKIMIRRGDVQQRAQGKFLIRVA